MYLHVCIYSCTLCVCLYLDSYLRSDLCLVVYLYLYLHLYLHAYVNEHEHEHVHVHMHVCVCVCIDIVFNRQSFSPSFMHTLCMSP